MPKKIRTASPKEDEFTDSIRELATAYGYQMYHTRVSYKNIVGHLAEGFPDLILAGRGRLLALEVKRPGKSPTIAQLAWIAHINRAKKIIAEVVYTDNLQYVADLLSEPEEK